MKRIDKSIKDIDDNICKNIDRIRDDRGHLSQNILSQLRTFVEHVAMKYYFESTNSDLSTVPEEYYNDIKNGLNFMNRNPKLDFLKNFHPLLQKSVSHYTVNEENSERLMLKYYEYLLKIKKNVETDFNLSVLENINIFPVNLDHQLNDYYEKIVEKLNLIMIGIPMGERYYIQKKKPFFINNEIYYEITFSEANDNASKFERNIAFTKHDILPNYAVKLSINKEEIDIYGQKMPILIISDWDVSIRPCEIRNFSDILGKFANVQSNHNEYKRLMEFMKKRRMTLLDIFLLDDDYYFKVKEYITKESKKIMMFKSFDRCRHIIINNLQGSNLLRYLSYTLNNRVIKLQTDYWGNCCHRLSDLKVSYGCIPFDDMPFSTSLIRHNPRFYDLVCSIDAEGREHELLARKIQTNSQTNGRLYTSIEELENYEDIENLRLTYNRKLYSKHKESRKICNLGRNYYINEYEEELVRIIKNLKEQSLNGLENYENSVVSWLNNSTHDIDCDHKKELLKMMFSESKVSLIYGAAGTGKSTMINHVGNFFGNQQKLLLANTNPAVDNLKRKVKAPNCEYKTIAKYLYSRDSQDCDILIIDECSTVSNKDMSKILSKENFKLLILVGDTYQIESITFGNWFKLTKNNMPKKSISELTIPYRTEEENLLSLWSKVRNNDDDLVEYLTANNYSIKLDESVFDSTQSDEIILCLNYDGLYGINNINRFLQSNNSSKSIDWGVLSYKVGDPILFSESSRFSPVLFNNLKGKIVGIEKKEEEEIIFDIEIDIVINELDIDNLNLELISSTEEKSIVRFSVYRYENMSDDDNDDNNTIVPFQVAYAVSIHKAQGLEFDSVKLIITNEVDELITHNIFYTAITRTKKDLKIYWTPETEKKVLDNISKVDRNKDESILQRLLK